MLRDAVKDSRNWTDVIAKIKCGDGGSMRDYLKKKCDKYGIDYSHFTRKHVPGLPHPHRGTPSNKKKKPEEILVMRPTGSLRVVANKLRRALLESGVDESCRECGLKDSWNGKRIRLEIDHIDGNHLNCMIENLRFICPNCHSQTPTFRRYGKMVNLQ